MNHNLNKERKIKIKRGDKIVRRIKMKNKSSQISNSRIKKGKIKLTKNL